ncbi:CGNR zinc finger domain-containing protein [Pseudonocardia kunmingensis]|uniref:Putative RNA-binding Zn ribbon-like protein n=1 Tax=Pseudonocardia kunmingensis TaxID=630975 RepID=A0A543E0L5_9PSEU|nr:ABATE domain-containing protein [Pseudonocardia kunmingensis]TQM15118.1 putative RNA-binding Zn ribbon-like protein [Pseudonocardia kunmingensis]
MRFQFVGGNLALDFVGTVAEWTTSRTELLVAPADLGAWLAEAGVLDHAPEVSTADLAAARELRGAIRGLVVALEAGQPVPVEVGEVVNRYAAVEPVLLRLDATGRPVRRGTVGAALSSVARSGIELAEPSTAGLLRSCADATCTRAFLDRSRGRRRRWCGMSGCGDRAKAAAYRSRHRRS